MVKRCPIGHLQGLRCALNLTYQPGKPVETLQDYTCNYILNTRLDKNRTDLLNRLITDDKWPWEPKVAGKVDIAQDPATKKALESINEDPKAQPHDQMTWLDAIRAVNPGTPNPKGAVLELDPPKLSLQQHQRKASEHKKKLTKTADRMAKAISKKLDLPADMAPRVLKALRNFTSKEFQAVTGLGHAELRCAVLEQHCSGTNNESSAAS